MLPVIHFKYMMVIHGRGKDDIQLRSAEHIRGHLLNKILGYQSHDGDRNTFQVFAPTLDS